jgi:hypothetical protein
MARIRSLLWPALAALACAILAAPAGAAGGASYPMPVVTVTFTGVIDQSGDPDGLLGCDPFTTCTDVNPYDGDTFTAVYIFNTRVGYSESPTEVLAIGGSTFLNNNDKDNPFSIASALISDSITISSPDDSSIYNFSIDGSYYAELAIDTYFS